jgi:5'-3' exonuclease
MRALIDADMLLYQIGFASQYKDEETDELIVLPFDKAKAKMDLQIEDILQATGADSYTLYITGEGNFREAIAKVKGYKENRKEAQKPYHYDNLLGYCVHCLGAVVVDGMEADDILAYNQVTCMQLNDPLPTVICSRDKDLRMVPGYHYSWECGLQPERDMYWVEELGELIPVWQEREDKPPLFKKLEGTGLRWFYAQVLMGDSVDNIPGLPKCGPKGAYEALSGCESEEELYKVVLGMYEEKYAENALQELTEQARLLWMVRELDREGNPVMWEPPIQTTSNGAQNAINT